MHLISDSIKKGPIDRLISRFGKATGPFIFYKQTHLFKQELSLLLICSFSSLKEVVSVQLQSAVLFVAAFVCLGGRRLRNSRSDSKTSNAAHEQKDKNNILQFEAVGV